MPLRRNVYLMYGISFLQGMLFYVSISTLYRQVCGISIFQIMLIECVCTTLSMALEVPWGAAAERMGYKKVMVICTFLLAFSKYIFYIADTFWLFLAERVVLGVVYSGLSGVDSSIVYLSSGEESSQRVFGIRSAANSAGLLIASAIYAALPEGSYRLAALLSIFTYGAAAILTLFLAEVREKPEKRENMLAATIKCAKDMKRMKGIVPLLIMNVLFFEIIMNITGFFRQLQFVRGGAGTRFISIALMIGTVCEMSGAFSDRLTRLLGERHSGLLVIALCAAGCFGMAVSASVMLTLTVVSFMCAACVMMGALTATMENKLVISDDRATALSINSMLTGIVAVPLNLGLGYIVDIDLPLSFVICGILLIFAGIAFYRASE